MSTLSVHGDTRWQDPCSPLVRALQDDNLSQHFWTSSTRYSKLYTETAYSFGGVTRKKRFLFKEHQKRSLNDFLKFTFSLFVWFTMMENAKIISGLFTFCQNAGLWALITLLRKWMLSIYQKQSFWLSLRRGCNRSGRFPATAQTNRPWKISLNFISFQTCFHKLYLPLH